MRIDEVHSDRKLGFVSGAAIGAALLLLASGCPGKLEDPTIFGDELDCVAFTEQYIEQSCSISGCHDAATQAAGLSLIGDDIGAALLDQPASADCPGNLIDSSDPTQSLMFTKLTSSPPCGDQMPLFARAPAQFEIDCMREWVQAQQIGPP
ncbi:MAG: hypothetical protein AAF658_15885 [Myxococcota bacterium]